ncbi:olfactomedin-like protein 3A [Salarias fasciatus]|uniref:Olfactomedin-like protein 3A n=1 Tax=Salarias fasciatus TaxID=181472 RepID=A0A672I4B9_SALFA|nr:olfactomedin-like protein 3A [Salarias fasciatus]
MVCRVLLVLLLSLGVSVPSGRSQSSSQDAFIIQYLERRLVQVEERLGQCEQRTVSLSQRTYELSSEVRGCVSRLSALRSEVSSQADGVSARVERLERELEYLENRFPVQSQVEVEAALLEEQIRAAELELQGAWDRDRGRGRGRGRDRAEHDCGAVLDQIRSVKIVKKAGDAQGCWFKDPTAGSSKVYLLSGVQNDTVLEFDSLQSFVEQGGSPGARQLQLPAHWQGSGHTVHNGFLYFHKADTHNQILKVDLLNRTVVDSTLVPGAGRLPVYSLNPDTYLDLSVDQLGLWVVHADPDYGGNLVLTKLDTGTLAVDFSWDTQCRSQDAEGAFLICGTLYVVYSSRYGGRASIQCVYDVHDSVHSVDGPVRFFPKRFSSHSSLRFHPEDQDLYAWDDGYQTIYRVETVQTQRVPVD